MNQTKAAVSLVISAALAASVALADDFKTMDGKEYKDATVSRVEPDGIVVKTKSGISKLYFVQLPKEVQQRFNYDSQTASAYSAQQAAQYEVYQKQQGGPALSLVGSVGYRTTDDSGRRGGSRLRQDRALVGA
jgi:hypothetical protein